MDEPREKQSARLIANLGDIEPGSSLCVAYGLLQDCREGRTRKNEAFLDLCLFDTTARVKAKIWPDEAAAQEAARALVRGTPVKVLFRADLYQGAVQLRIHKIRAAAGGDEGYDARRLFGPGYELVRDVLAARVAFDIETVPAADRRGLPPTVSESLARAAERMDADEAKVMGLSPFFGKVVSLAVADADAVEPQVTVFVVPPRHRSPAELPAWIRPVTEPELLQAWWALATAAETVVSFNGRGFDVPFLVARSLVHDISASVDLLSNRYALRPHLDLYRALTHGERSLGPTNLDVICWALGIASPKEQMDGSMVAPAYERGEIESIARYNARDVRATVAVYQRLRDRVLRFREDW